MAKPVRHSEGGDFARLPQHEWVHVVIRSATLKPSAFYKNNDGSPKDRVEVVFEAVPGATHDGESIAGARAWARPGFSLHPKSGLRPIAIATMPRDPKDDDELYSVFDTDKLEGKQLLILGEYPAEDSDYLKPKMFKRLPKSKWVEVNLEESKTAEPEDDKPADDDVMEF